MLVRVVEPPSGKEWIHNGFFKVRVYRDRGDESITELPDVLLRWDKATESWTEKKCEVPSWGEYVGPSPEGEWKQKVGDYPVEKKPKNARVRNIPADGAKIVAPKGKGKRASETEVG